MSHGDVQAMSGSMALLQPGSVLKSNAPVTIEDRYPRAKAMLVSQGHIVIETVVIFRPSYCGGPCWESLVLPWLGSELKSWSCIATKDHIEAQGWGCSLRPWWYPLAVSIGHMAARTIPENTCGAVPSTQSQDVSGPKLLQRAMSEFMVQQ